MICPKCKGDTRVGAESSMVLLPTSAKAAAKIGSPHYFTGKPCGRGHMSARLTCGRKCLKCDEESRAERYQRHRDYNRAYAAKWRAEHPEESKAQRSKWRQENRNRERELDRARYAKGGEVSRSRASARSAEWRRRNPEKAREKQRRWVSANKGSEAFLARRRERQKAWKLKNPDKVRVFYSVNKARRKGAPGKYTEEDVSRIRKLQAGKCAHCRLVLKDAYHVDHITPICRGGTSWPNNIQLLCAPCNLRKSGKDPVAFARQEGRLI